MEPISSCQPIIWWTTSWAGHNMQTMNEIALKPEDLGRFCAGKGEVGVHLHNRSSKLLPFLSLKIDKLQNLYLNREQKSKIPHFYESTLFPPFRMVTIIHKEMVKSRKIKQRTSAQKQMRKKKKKASCT